MIGNDVVDLTISEFKSEQRFWRYANKMCSAREQAQFGVFEARDISIWRFWSLKEAAFKAAVRLGYAEDFSPSGTLVVLLDNTQSKISLGDLEFLGSSELSGDCLYAEVRHCSAALKKVSRRSADNPRAIEYKGCLPYVSMGRDTLYPASLSHHGKYYRLIYWSA